MQPVNLFLFNSSEISSSVKFTLGVGEKMLNVYNEFFCDGPIYKPLTATYFKGFETKSFGLNYYDMYHELVYNTEDLYNSSPIYEKQRFN